VFICQPELGKCLYLSDKWTNVYICQTELDKCLYPPDRTAVLRLTLFQLCGVKRELLSWGLDYSSPYMADNFLSRTAVSVQSWHIYKVHVKLAMLGGEGGGVRARIHFSQPW